VAEELAELHLSKLSAQMDMETPMHEGQAATAAEMYPLSADLACSTETQTDLTAFPSAHKEPDPKASVHNAARSLVAQFVDEGISTNDMARRVLQAAGFTMEKSDVRIPDTGMIVPFVVRDAQGEQWHVDLCGTNIASRGGLNRLDTTWRAIARGSILEGVGTKRLLMLTPKMPRPKSEQDRLIRGWLATRDSGNFHAQLIDLSDPASITELLQR
jgi:hypothetical protein